MSYFIRGPWWPSGLRHMLIDHSASHDIGLILAQTFPSVRKFAVSLAEGG